jgi:hypothetical protein
MERGDEALRDGGACVPQALLSSPGIAVRRTASLPLAYDRAAQYTVTSVVLRKPLEYWITRFRG